MLIKKLHLQNFKRFANLEIDLDPENTGNLPKLVLLVGANGSGKSSIFDAFGLSGRVSKITGLNEITATKNRINYRSEFELSEAKSFADYYAKNFERLQSVEYEFIDQDKFPHYFSLKYLYPDIGIEKSPTITDKTFYGRTAFRFLPRLQKTTINGGVSISGDQDKPEFFTDLDNRFDNDIDYLFNKIFKDALKADTQEKEGVKFKNKFNAAFARIFGQVGSTSLAFEDIELPFDGNYARIWFSKGNSRLNYDLLSAGEKQVVNILFNLYARAEFFTDSIYFLDEIDLHLNTSLQKSLLQEITENWIPPNCQLWAASHSLGFIEYAKEYENGAVIDLDNLDFDQPQKLKRQKEEAMKVYEIAVPQESLAKLFQDKQRIYCENTNSKYYNLLGLEDKIFLSEKDKNSVFLIIENETSPDVLGVIDRDFLSLEEIEKLKKKFKNLRILHYYCFENYLWHPENIAQAVPDFDKQTYIQKITEVKNQENDRIKASLNQSRSGYIFFKKEKDYGIKLKDDGLENIFRLLNSDNLEDFYQVFSMKDKGNLAGNLNLPKSDLVKTDWFKTKINEVLQ